MMNLNIKSRFVQLNIDLEDQEKTALLLKDAADKETATRCEEIKNNDYLGGSRLRKASQAHQVMLASSLSGANVWLEFNRPANLKVYCDRF